ncbi:unnamed protein product, partial [marine sediment metagenome]
HDVEQVLIGSMLGDGCIGCYPKYRDAWFTESKKIEHIDYLGWKAKILSEFGGSIREREGESGLPHLGSRQFKAAVFRTFVHPLFTQLRHIWYPNGKKVVPEGELQKLDELGLAVWYMDDGSYGVLTRSCLISTGSFTLDEQILTKDAFKEKWGLIPKIIPAGKGYGLDFLVSDTDKLLRVMAPFIHPDMVYKLGHIHPDNLGRINQMRRAYLERRRQREKERYHSDSTYREHILEHNRKCREEVRS